MVASNGPNSRCSYAVMVGVVSVIGVTGVVGRLASSTISEAGCCSVKTANNGMHTYIHAYTHTHIYTYTTVPSYLGDLVNRHASVLGQAAMFWCSSRACRVYMDGWERFVAIQSGGLCLSIAHTMVVAVASHHPKPSPQSSLRLSSFCFCLFALRCSLLAAHCSLLALRQQPW